MVPSTLDTQDDVGNSVGLHIGCTACFWAFPSGVTDDMWSLFSAGDLGEMWGLALRFRVMVFGNFGQCSALGVQVFIQ